MLTPSQRDKPTQGIKVLNKSNIVSSGILTAGSDRDQGDKETPKLSAKMSSRPGENTAELSKVALTPQKQSAERNQDAWKNQQETRSIIGRDGASGSKISRWEMRERRTKKWIEATNSPQCVQRNVQRFRRQDEDNKAEMYPEIHLDTPMTQERIKELVETFQFLQATSPEDLDDYIEIEDPQTGISFYQQIKYTLPNACFFCHQVGHPVRNCPERAARKAPLQETEKDLGDKRQDVKHQTEAGKEKTGGEDFQEVKNKKNKQEKDKGVRNQDKQNSNLFEALQDLDDFEQDLQGEVMLEPSTKHEQTDDTESQSMSIEMSANKDKRKRTEDERDQRKIQGQM
ncbi:hypothetical protein R1sor_002832 [Riccia sorocarpa]|uniref:CCHC-type domain-containing protein n=1 Tax=Riccia sorocarpa TaxID=122646 RepID=A0ABD3GZW1_9MARC